MKICSRSFIGIVLQRVTRGKKKKTINHKRSSDLEDMGAPMRDKYSSLKQLLCFSGGRHSYLYMHNELIIT
jgi:hypothetical protein